jgi:hypothetical protein
MSREQAAAVLSVFNLLALMKKFTPSVIAEIAAVYIDTYNSVPEGLVTDFLEDVKEAGKDWPFLFGGIARNLVAFTERESVPSIFEEPHNIPDPIRGSAIYSLPDEDSALVGGVSIDIDGEKWEAMSDTDKVRFVQNITEQIRQAHEVQKEQKYTKGGMVH